MACNDRVTIEGDDHEPTPEELLDLKDTLMLMLEDIMGLVESIGQAAAATDIRNGFEKLGGDAAIVAAYRRQGRRDGYFPYLVDARFSEFG